MTVTPRIRVIVGIFWLATLVACAVYVSRQWSVWSNGRGAQEIQLAWIVAAGIPLLVHYLIVFGLWLSLLRALGAQPTVTAAARAYVLSLLPKYLPGRLAAPGVRTAIALRAGVPAEAVSGSLFLEAGFGLASAAIVAAVGLGLDLTTSLQGAAQWFVAVFAVVVLGLAVTAATPAFRWRWSRWAGLAHMLARPRTGLLLLGLYVATWVLPTLSHWILARAVWPLSVAELPSLMVALAVSWGVGALSLFAPAGLGVREGVLFLFVRQWMAEPQAIVFVTLSRLLSIGVELLLSAAWAAYATLTEYRADPVPR